MGNPELFKETLVQAADFLDGIVPESDINPDAKRIADRLIFRRNVKALIELTRSHDEFVE